jgi:hypothetical protein
VGRERVSQVLREHDVVCVPSLTRDPCPLVCFEAMAAGCALLGGDRGGIPEISGDAGVLVDPDDIEQLTEALGRLATDPQWLRRTKQSCLARAQAMQWADRAVELLHLSGLGPHEAAAQREADGTGSMQLAQVQRGARSDVDTVVCKAGPRRTDTL